MGLTKTWNAKMGLWNFSCGCIQYQDGFDLCEKHRPNGYISLLRELEYINHGKNASTETREV